MIAEWNEKSKDGTQLTNAMIWSNIWTTTTLGESLNDELLISMKIDYNGDDAETFP